jgi:hypothetical protein
MGEFFEPNLQAAMIESRSEDCQPLQSAILVALIPVRRWLSFYASLGRLPKAVMFDKQSTES